MVSSAQAACWLILVALSAYDLLYRRVPNRVVLILAAFVGLGWTLGRWELSLTGALCGLLLGAVANVPGGDLKALVLVGALTGGVSIGLTFALAGFLTLLVWWLTDLRSWPWIPLLAGSWVLVEAVLAVL